MICRLYHQHHNHPSQYIENIIISRNVIIISVHHGVHLIKPTSLRCNEIVCSLSNNHRLGHMKLLRPSSRIAAYPRLITWVIDYIDCLCADGQSLAWDFEKRCSANPRVLFKARLMELCDFERQSFWPMYIDSLMISILRMGLMGLMAGTDLVSMDDETTIKHEEFRVFLL